MHLHPYFWTVVLNEENMILIVDDSATNLLLLEVVLREEGYETLTAFSANEALKIIKSRKPKLILLDLMMPEVSGFDFLKKLKDNPNNSDVPVFIISAIGSNDSKTFCLDHGATEYFEKPIDIQPFVKKVRQYLPL